MLFIHFIKINHFFKLYFVYLFDDNVVENLFGENYFI